MTKRIILCLLALLLAVPCMAESGSQQAEIDALHAEIAALNARIAELEAQLAAYEPAIDPETPIITFSGGSISVAQAQAAYDELAAIYTEFGIDKATYHDMLAEEVLANLAEDAILTAKAQQLGVYENSAEDIAAAELEAQNSYDSVVAYYLPYFQDETLTEEEVRANTVEYLESEGESYQAILDDILDTLWRNRLYEASTADISLTDDDVRALYDSSLASAQQMYAEDPLMYEYDYASGNVMFWHPEGYREVEYMLIPWSDEELEIEDESLRFDALTRRCESLIDRAIAGENLFTLAEEAMLNDYGTAAVGSEPGMMSDSFCAIASRMALNDTQPAADADGVWVIRYVADVTPGAVPYESLQAQLTEAAAETMKLEAYSAMVDQWLAEAEIVTHPEYLR